MADENELNREDRDNVAESAHRRPQPAVERKIDLASDKTEPVATKEQVQPQQPTQPQPAPQPPVPGYQLCPYCHQPCGYYYPPYYQQPPMPPKPENLCGVSGWLAAFTVWFFYKGITSLLVALAMFSIIVDTTTADTMNWPFASLISSIIIGAVMLWAGVSVASRMKNARGHVYSSLIITSVMTILTTGMLMVDLVNESSDSRNNIAIITLLSGYCLIRIIAYVLIGQYFANSKRVKLTLVDKPQPETARKQGDK